jgi:lipid-A-disaccharide synthase
MEKEGLNSAFKMEDITVMGAAELFPHMFRIWVCFLNSPVSS